ncbi:hypothetical protein GW7_17689 [Heterocephalus glaber]|uniref:Uncharacterized protein n=1 Tax=Heterocephalus glaber TaxID=10181 RepID=G5C6A0_HETGA|nr:hypothetical protein GW7_17689 [Heterocephalus glaber]
MRATDTLAPGARSKVWTPGAAHGDKGDNCVQGLHLLTAPWTQTASSHRRAVEDARPGALGSQELRRALRRLRGLPDEPECLPKEAFAWDAHGC